MHSQARATRSPGQDRSRVHRKGDGFRRREPKGGQTWDAQTDVLPAEPRRPGPAHAAMRSCTGSCRLSELLVSVFGAAGPRTNSTVTGDPDRKQWDRLGRYAAAACSKISWGEREQVPTSDAEGRCFADGIFGDTLALDLHRGAGPLYCRSEAADQTPHRDRSRTVRHTQRLSRPCNPSAWHRPAKADGGGIGVSPVGPLQTPESGVPHSLV